MAKRVAVLGLGVMGAAMASNLRKAGFDVVVWNRTVSKAESFAKVGGTAADTPAKAVAGALIVISMLADDVASRTAWFGENGALAAMDAGTIAIESSTASPDWISELNTAAHMRGVRLLDAPVTGSRMQAESAQLVFLTGGDPETIEEARPALAAMSRLVLPLGPVGSGAQLKLINNFLCGVQVAAFAEALTWIERNGLNRAVALNFLKTAAPGSGILASMIERMTERTYEVNFALNLMRKDLGYAQTAAEAFNVSLSTAVGAEQLFVQAQREGYGDRDMSAVVEVLRHEA